MKRRMIAPAILCLLLLGTTLAAADPDRGRGDRKDDRGSRTEEKSRTRRSTNQRSVERSDGRTYDRRVTEARREPSRTVQRGDWRTSDRQTTQRWAERSPIVRERSASRVRVNEHVVTRTATPRDWRTRSVRGRGQYATWDGHRAKRWKLEHRTWRARGGYHGYRIPDYRYRVAFGPRHRFHVDNCPLVVVSGYPRFYYGGYWVTFIDPWPEYWDDYWFARDDSYIVYADDGYYLTNVRYPGVLVAVSVTLG